MESIGYEAFEYCTGLESIKIPLKVKKIGMYAFEYCSNLKKIILPESVESIGTDAFSGCNEKVAIYGYEGTYAQQYANENDITFLIIGASNDNYFKLHIDNNQFTHYAMSYKIENNNYKTQLYKNSSWVGKVKLSQYLDEEKRGVCHGIAMTMCYANQGLLNFDYIVSGSKNYWQLKSPYNNTKFSDIIMYYQLSQLSLDGKASKTLDKNGWNSILLKDRMKNFLKAFVDEAKKSQAERKPFIFSYKENGDGHSVIVCGYKWNESKKIHEIKIYDENTYEEKFKGYYITMTIPEDYSSFDYTDYNASYGGYKIQDVWTSICYYSIDKLYENKNILQSYSTLSELNSDNSDEKITINITYGKKFTLENSKGESISYDGENYTGNMKVYDCYTSGLEGDYVWNITVDSSDKFILTKADSGCELITYINNKGYAVSSDGAESVQIQSDNVTAKGDSYKLNVLIQSDKCDCLEVETTAKGTISINEEKDKLKIVSSGGTENTKVYSYSSLDKKELNSNESNNEIIIDETQIYEYNKLSDINNGLTYQTDSTTGIKLVKGISADKKVSELKKDFENADISVKNADGQLLTDNDIIGTGCILNLIKNNEELDKAVVIIKGDVDGNGTIDVLDMETIQKSILGIGDSLSGVYKEAGLLSGDDTDEVTVLDMEAIQKDILGIEKIN